MGEVQSKSAKLSKDEIISQLQQQNEYLVNDRKRLVEHINKQNEDGFYKRLDYLFKVIENAPLFHELNKDFVLKCAAEITDVITIVDKPTDECLDQCDCDGAQHAE